VVDFQKCVAFYSFGPAGIPVSYYRCDACGFLFTPFFDDWLPSEFARYVYNEDYALLDPDYAALRPRNTATLVSELLNEFHDARILDYGAGAGVFAQCMSEMGFPYVAGYDPFSMPNRPDGEFDIAIATEVIEHSPDPVGLLADMTSFLTPGGCILLGESLQPANIDAVRGNWWYIAPRNGHVSAFTDRTLVTLARRHGMIFHRGGGFPHAFRPAEASRFTSLAERVGVALECFRLGAPGEWPAEGFNGIEGLPGDQFQWTASDKLSWRVHVPSGGDRLVQVMIPFSHQSRSGFAAECRIEVGGIPSPASIRESSLFAEAGPIAPGEIQITLHTPELKTAPNDGRRLGLAVKVLRNANV
jgi:SAM-dependent methyltransferase